MRGITETRRPGEQNWPVRCVRLPSGFAIRFEESWWEPVTELAVYVAPGCFGCDRALELVEEVRVQIGNHVTVTVVDIAEEDKSIPESLFAVPSWYLDGELVSLGNPTVDEILEAVGVEWSYPNNWLA